MTTSFATSALSRRALPVVAALLCVIGLTGCGSLRVPVSDDNSPAASVRAVIRSQAADSGLRAGPGVEFGYDRYRAKDTRTLALNEIFSVGGVDVTGPDALRQQATVEHAHVAYTHLLRYGANFELEPFVGATRLKFRFSAEPSTSLLRPELSASRTGVIGGITPRWRFNEWVAIELRVTGTSGRGMESFSTDAGLVLSPIPNLSFRLGYSKREQTVQDDLSITRVEVDAKGPSARLQLDF